MAMNFRLCMVQSIHAFFSKIDFFKNHLAHHGRGLTQACYGYNFLASTARFWHVVPAHGQQACCTMPVAPHPFSNWELYVISFSLLFVKKRSQTHLLVSVVFDPMTPEFWYFWWWMCRLDGTNCKEKRRITSRDQVMQQQPTAVV